LKEKKTFKKYSLTSLHEKLRKEAEKNSLLIIDVLDEYKNFDSEEIKNNSEEIPTTVLAVECKAPHKAVLARVYPVPRYTWSKTSSPEEIQTQLNDSWHRIQQGISNPI